MLDVLTYLNFSDLFANRVFIDHQPDVARNLQMTSAIRPVHTLDGWIVCAAVRRRAQIAATFSALGHPEWTDEVLAQPNQHSLAAAMYDGIERATQELTVEQALACFRVADVPAAECISMDGPTSTTPRCSTPSCTTSKSGPTSATSAPCATPPPSAPGATSPPTALPPSSASTTKRSPGPLPSDPHRGGCTRDTDAPHLGAC